MTRTPEKDLEDIRQDEERLRTLYRRHQPATSAELDGRILKAIGAEAKRRPAMTWWGGFSAAAGLLLAVGAAWFVATNIGEDRAPMAMATSGPERDVEPPRDVAERMAEEQARAEQRRVELAAEQQKDAAKALQTGKADPGSSPGTTKTPDSGASTAAGCTWSGTLRVYLDANQNGRRDAAEQLVKAYTGFRLTVRGAPLTDSRPSEHETRPGELIVKQAYPDCVPRQFRPRIRIDESQYRLTTPAELEDNAEHVFEFGVVQVHPKGKAS